MSLAYYTMTFPIGKEQFNIFFFLSLLSYTILNALKRKKLRIESHFKLEIKSFPPPPAPSLTI